MGDGTKRELREVGVEGRPLITSIVARTVLSVDVSMSVQELETIASILDRAREHITLTPIEATIVAEFHAALDSIR